MAKNRRDFRAGHKPGVTFRVDGGDKTGAKEGGFCFFHGFAPYRESICPAARKVKAAPKSGVLAVFAAGFRALLPAVFFHKRGLGGFEFRLFPGAVLKDPAIDRDKIQFFNPGYAGTGVDPADVPAILKRILFNLRIALKGYFLQDGAAQKGVAANDCYSGWYGDGPQLGTSLEYPAVLVGNAA
jgi:hypothetical protein